jgi:hypothetical protein
MTGEAATFLQRGGSTGLGASGDRDAAAAIAHAMSAGEEVEAALVVDDACCRAALEDSRTWDQVQRLAQALLQVRTWTAMTCGACASLPSS